MLEVEHSCLYGPKYTACYHDSGPCLLIPRPGICLSLVGLVILGTLGLLMPWPATLAALLLDPPSKASRSRNSDQSSASDSLLPLVLSGIKSDDNEGVLGVRRNGDSGTLRAELEAPGRASPACSLCAVVTCQPVHSRRKSNGERITYLLSIPAVQQ